jgi:hypothetical protein
MKDYRMRRPHPRRAIAVSAESTSRRIEIPGDRGHRQLKSFVAHHRRTAAVGVDRNRAIGRLITRLARS